VDYPGAGDEDFESLLFPGSGTRLRSATRHRARSDSRRWCAPSAGNGCCIRFGIAPGTCAWSAGTPAAANSGDLASRKAIPKLSTDCCSALYIITFRPLA